MTLTNVDQSQLWGTLEFKYTKRVVKKSNNKAKLDKHQQAFPPCLAWDVFRL